MSLGTQALSQDLSGPIQETPTALTGGSLRIGVTVAAVLRY